MIGWMYNTVCSQRANDGKDPRKLELHGIQDQTIIDGIVPRKRFVSEVDQNFDIKSIFNFTDEESSKNQLSTLLSPSLPLYSLLSCNSERKTKSMMKFDKNVIQSVSPMTMFETPEVGKE